MCPRENYFKNILLFITALATDTLLQSTAEIDSLNSKAFDIRNTDTQKSILLCRQAIELATKINYSLGNAVALKNIAFCYIQISEYQLALETLFTALELFTELGNEKGLAEVHYNFCLIYSRISDFATGIESVSKALEFFKKVNDKLEMARCYFQLSAFHLSLSDTESATEFATKSLKLNRAVKNLAGEATAIMAMGQVHLNLKEYKKSKKLLLSSLTIRKKIRDWRGYAASLNSYLTLCIDTEKYEEAELIAIKGIKLSQKLQDKMAVSRFTVALGRIYLFLNKLEQSEKYLKEALAIAKTINLRIALAPSHLALAEINESRKNYEKALDHYKQYHEVSTEMINLEGAIKVKRIEFFNKINTAQNEAKINKLINVELKKAYEIIENKNQDITASINYAKRIQEAQLPKQKEIEQWLKESFILFKPKDIVSGDFYFFYRTNKLIFLAAVDCTGHGVPGSLMSMIGNEKLVEATRKNKKTADILAQLNKKIKISLHQTELTESMRDGMDIALCSINVEKQLLNFSGANRPLWLIRKNSNVLEEIKGTKSAIAGLTSDQQKYATCKLKLKTGDTFYLFTDGYADQFGWDKDKKLMTKKFKEILLSIQSLSLPEQKIYLTKFIEKWKGDFEQVDDILVMGVRL